MPETRLVAKLKATAAVTDLIVDRIRKHQRKTSWGDSDAITYQRVGTDRVGGADASSTTSFVRIQLDVWSSTPTGARALADAVKDALDDWEDEVNSPEIGKCRLINDMDDPQTPDAGDEAREHRIIQEYLIGYAE